jgi:hypothetical protein
MTVSDACNARNRATCRFHGAVDHARIDLANAREQYDAVLAEYVALDPEIRALPESTYSAASILKLQLSNARANFNKAQTEFDSFPIQFKTLKALIDLAEADDEGLPELKTRYRKAEELRKVQAQERKIEKEKTKAEKTARAKNEEVFKRISGEVGSEKKDSTNDWKVGYKKAVSGVIAEEGFIVNGAGSSSYGIYSMDKNAEKTTHFRECGSLDIRNVEEDSWEEWNFSSMSDEQSSRTEYKVTADATCNCGQITCEKIQISGTFADITRKVLSF